ncbi:MAG: hypothetical protein WD688_04315 [Candidatus Binatia bacterium]
MAQRLIPEEEERRARGTTRNISGSSRTEFVLTVVAFIAGAVPIFMLLLGGMAAMMSMGMTMMDTMSKPPDPAMQQPMMKAMHSFMTGYIPYVLVPAIIILGVIWGYASANYPRLSNRIDAGLAAGFIASLGLDVFRLIGVALGAFPGDMPTMFGKTITGQMEIGPGVLLAGYTYHLLLNGTTFGMMYTLLAGKAHWLWGLAWGLFFELGMMVLPPVPMMAGPFGIHGFWPSLFIASLIAHVVFGVILGLLAQRWVRDRGTMFSLLTERSPSAVRRRSTIGL